jgi:hypothetical protein
MPRRCSGAGTEREKGGKRDDQSGQQGQSAFHARHVTRLGAFEHPQFGQEEEGFSARLHVLCCRSSSSLLAVSVSCYHLGKNLSSGAKRLAGKAQSKGHRVLLWISFSVIFALCPIFIDFLLTRGSANFQPLRLLSRGELFLISAAICADAVGRMWGQKPQTGYFSTICMVCCIFILFMSSTEFGMNAQSLDEGKRLSDSVTRDSLIMFVVTVVAGLGAILVEE